MCTCVHVCLLECVPTCVYVHSSTHIIYVCTTVYTYASRHVDLACGSASLRECVRACMRVSVGV